MRLSATVQKVEMSVGFYISRSADSRSTNSSMNPDQSLDRVPVFDRTGNSMLSIDDSNVSGEESEPLPFVYERKAE
ncbi:hypothetical protein V1478_014528 [Vespula squamosa]|uniref:Uncharacterized protein n=1 Tax=Vespula squamosa TaxID=30214 RepID=A0ABD2A890_VESSQ